MNRLIFDQLNVRFGHGAKATQAVQNFSLSVPAGKVVGLVGESGSGKSTVARAAVGLCEPNSGSIRWETSSGKHMELSHARGAAQRARRRVQMIFQDPSSCLDPRMSVGQSISEALRAVERRRRSDSGESPAMRENVRSRAKRVAELLESVRLPAARAEDLPHSLSGGQRQRVALARALAAEPAFILADEITSALDVSVQGSILNLLTEVQAELQFGLLFISHNLAVVRYLCDEVAVMQAGALIEKGTVQNVLEHPRESYTRQLLAAVPGIGQPLFAETITAEKASS